MIGLGTYVISELGRQTPGPGVFSRLDLDAIVATRNTADFEEALVELIDPWKTG